MDERTRSCTWDDFCEYLALFSEDDDFVLVAQEMDLDLGPLKELPKEKVLISSDSDSNMILNAAGLALNGKKPWVIGLSSKILSRSYSQIRESLAIPSLPVRIAVPDGGLSCGEEGASRIIGEDLSLMRAMPNMCVTIPSDRNSTRGIMDAARKSDGPVYIRLGQTPLAQLNNGQDEDFSFGGARLLREGTSVTVCTCGIMAHQALKAAEILDQQGIDIEILDCYSLKPFPEQTLLASVRRTGCCVVAEEHSSVGGLCSATAECLSRTYPVPVKFVAIDDQFVHSGTPEELREYLGLTWKEIVSAAAQAWALRRR
jgi:transketolase